MIFRAATFSILTDMVAMWLLRRKYRNPSRRRWRIATTAADENNNNNKIRRRDGAQPKNHRQPSPPVAFAPPLWFLHLLLLLFYLPHSRRFLLLLLLLFHSFVGVSSFSPFRGRRRCHLPHCNTARRVSSLTAGTDGTTEQRKITHCSALAQHDTTTRHGTYRQTDRWPKRKFVHSFDRPLNGNRSKTKSERKKGNIRVWGRRRSVRIPGETLLLARRAATRDGPMAA